ncbi:hypothetical protein BpHYR1_046123 [Brachionus plicatilis]|uniref:Uncharacterized protein n=1 Tax=Brachionus plicatilis TaxID=10195 RepID=A0A3M7P564_BRAPC|nr:hypothetical protein BpHYR1_046123 [Brachionus plicatilis]
MFFIKQSFTSQTNGKFPYLKTLAMEKINKEQWNDEVTEINYQINLATNLPRQISTCKSWNK